MTESSNTYSSGNLTVDANLGRITCVRGRSLRLGPVNMKVLQTLVSRPGEVVSRAELFERIWKNQVVSDDTLTRCISDIRSQLNNTFGQAAYIETLPKRGYRWTLDDKNDGLSAVSEDSRTAGPREGRVRHGRWRRVLALGAVYAVALILLATAVAWVVDQAAQPRPIRLAVFPTESPDPDSSALARQVSAVLSARLLGVDGLQVLAKSAVDSRPQNPFPYFFYEFDARWVVESQIRRSDEHLRVTVSLVDARTGVVSFMKTADLDANRVEASISSVVADIQVHLNTTGSL
ncbi:MAG: winged helix-turn-helix domain-containing protein [Cellvibrionaceae bacterium]